MPKGFFGIWSVLSQSYYYWQYENEEVEFLLFIYAGLSRVVLFRCRRRATIIRLVSSIPTALILSTTNDVVSDVTRKVENWKRRYRGSKARLMNENATAQLNISSGSRNPLANTECVLWTKFRAEFGYQSAP